MQSSTGLPLAASIVRTRTGRHLVYTRPRGPAVYARVRTSVRSSVRVRVRTYALTHANAMHVLCVGGNSIRARVWTQTFCSKTFRMYYIVTLESNISTEPLAQSLLLAHIKWFPLTKRTCTKLSVLIRKLRFQEIGCSSDYTGIQPTSTQDLLVSLGECQAADPGLHLQRDGRGSKQTTTNVAYTC